MALPASNFFHGLLYYYGLELHHLTPESIAHIAIFVHLCEAFLGIEPHFDLFRHLFCVKPQSSKSNLFVIGGASIQLRKSALNQYLEYRFTTYLKWKVQWFYIANHAPQLPERSGKPLAFRPEWKRKVAPEDMDQVKDILNLTWCHKDSRVTGATVLQPFYLRRVQPLQHCDHLGFKYKGSLDPTRMSSEWLTPDQVVERVNRVLLNVRSIPEIPKLFDSSNPPDAVSSR